MNELIVSFEGGKDAKVNAEIVSKKVNAFMETYYEIENATYSRDGDVLATRHLAKQLIDLINAFAHGYYEAR